MVKYTQYLLTDWSTLHFICRDRKDGQYLNHNLNDYVAHGRSWCDASVYFKPAEDIFNAVEDVDKLVLASARIISRLWALIVKIGRTRERRRTLAESRTPIPANIILVGGNACK